MNILCTGSSGFIGREFIIQAAQAGHKVKQLPRALWTDSLFMREIDWNKWDSLVHLAAAGVTRGEHRNWAECMEANVHALQRMLGAISGTPILFLARSIRESELDRDPLLWSDPYYVTKKIGGLYAKAWATRYRGRVFTPEIHACYKPGHVQLVASNILRDITSVSQ